MTFPSETLNFLQPFCEKIPDPKLPPYYSLPFRGYFLLAVLVAMQKIWPFPKTHLRLLFRTYLCNRSHRIATLPKFNSKRILETTLKNWRNPESPRDNTWQSLGLILSCNKVLMVDKGLRFLLGAFFWSLTGEPCC